MAEALPLVDRVVILEPGGGVRADGTPAAVFAAHGDALADAGVWVPGRSVRARPAATAAGEVLLTAVRLGLPPRLAPTDLTVRAGEALAVLGPNGAGKTTLALQLGGLSKPGAGRLTPSPALAGPDAGTGTTPLAGGRTHPPHRLGLPGPGTPVPHRYGLRRTGPGATPDRSPRDNRTLHSG